MNEIVLSVHDTLLTDVHWLQLKERVLVVLYFCIYVVELSVLILYNILNNQHT